VNVGWDQADVVIELLVWPHGHWHAIWALWSTQAASISYVVLVTWGEPSSIRIDAVRALLKMSVTTVVAKWHTASLHTVWSNSECKALWALVILDLLLLLLLVFLLLLVLLLGLLLSNNFWKWSGQVWLLPLRSTGLGVLLKILLDLLLSLELSLAIVGLCTSAITSWLLLFLLFRL